MKRLKAAVVGMGFIGAAHVEALHRIPYVDVVAIGNGTASKESEIFISDTIRDYGGRVKYAMVSEAGASVYSAWRQTNFPISM